MEWHRNPPWMASKEDKPERQAKRTSQSNKPEQQARTPNQNNKEKQKPK